MHKPKPEPTPRRAGAWLILAPAILSACSTPNPMVTWVPTPEPKPGIDTMAVARTNAEELKAALQARATGFVGDKAALNNTLLGLGVLTLGLATGNTHRDAYTGTAGLAGTAYLFGNQNLQPAVLAAYQDGIGAVNCAVAAVGPMQVGPDTLAAFDRDAASLRDELKALAAAVSAAEVALAGVSNPPPALATAARQQIDDARATYTKGGAASKGAAELPQTVGRAAGGLKATLAEIHKTVNDLAAKGVADSAAVVASLKSLVSIITGFGQNLGVSVLAKPGAAGTASGGPGAQNDPGTKEGEKAPAPDMVQVEGLRSSLATLAVANAAVLVRAEPLGVQLDGFKTYKGTDELTKCKVTNATSAFNVDRPELEFTANDKEDQSARVVASGGTTPYAGRFRDSPTFGVEVVSPFAHDRTFEVKVPKTVKAGTSLMLSVTDGSTPPNERLVAVRVVAAAAAKAPGAQADLQGGPLAAALVKARNQGGTFSVGSGTRKVDYTVIKAASEAQGSQVELACSRVLADPHTQAVVKNALLPVLVSVYGLPQASADEVVAQPKMLVVQGNKKGCLK